MLILGEAHLRTIVAEDQVHYNSACRACDVAAGAPACVQPVGRVLRRRCGAWSASGWRTYDVLAARLRAGGFLAGSVSVNLDRNLGLVATQTLMFSFARIEGLAAMVQRLGEASAWVAADDRGLLRTGLAAHGR